MQAGETVPYAPLTIKFGSGRTGTLISFTPQKKKPAVTKKALRSSGTATSVPIGMPFAV